jgi:hypothetical protein
MCKSWRRCDQGCPARDYTALNRGYHARDEHQGIVGLVREDVKVRRDLEANCIEPTILQEEGGHLQSPRA